MVSRLVDEPTVHEDEFNRTIDSCFADAFIKGSGGFIIGSLMSVLFLRRRGWPILMGTGFGIGSAYQACEKKMQYMTATNNIPHQA